mgnify:CR=1 FL=1
MKLLASLAAAALAGYLALILAIEHLHALPGLLCSGDFSLPGLACSFAGLAATVLLVPAGGVTAGWTVWRLSGR